jgi:hypothetical protein
MEEAPENGKESSNSAHANGMNVLCGFAQSLQAICWTASQIGNGFFVPHPFQLVIHSFSNVMTYLLPTVPWPWGRLSP